MTQNESVGRTRRNVMAPAPCGCQHRALPKALAKALVYAPPSRSSDPGGRPVLGSWSNETVCAASRPWLTSLRDTCWVFLELVVAASCAAAINSS